MRKAMWSGWGAAGILITALACGDDGTSGPNDSSATLRVVQAAESTSAVDVLVDGRLAASALPLGALADDITLDPGDRTISVRPAGGGVSPSELRITAVAGVRYSAVVIDSATVLNPISLTDSGGIPAAGKTKLRVANYAALAGPIDVYRRQPDFPDLVSLMFPFEYRAVSAYVQSDPGDWQVLVSTEARVDGVPLAEPLDTLLVVDPIPIAPDGAVTVVLVDKEGGGIDAQIMQDR